MLQISAITVAMGVVNGVQTSSLDGCEAFRAKSYISVGTGIAQTVMVVLGAWLWGLKGAVTAMALGMVLTVIVTRWVVTKEWRRFNIRLRWREAKEEWRILVDFSLPTFLTMLFVGPVYWACSAFLANQPNGYAELGIFNAAIQWQGALLFLPGLVCTALIPVMSEKYGAGDVLGSLNVMKQMMKLLAATVIPIAIVLVFLSPWIMRGYGDSFAGGYGVFIILIATGTLGAIIHPALQLAVAGGMMWRSLYASLFWAAALLSMSWILIPWGAKGLATARLVAQVVFVLVYLYYIADIKKKRVAT
jgi:O-antigen/teichoic acid export membrane protein